ncbi:MAG: transcriptional regulator [Defluviitaleaceae bacterium]|nr:transcriptional regulator [Defluviitaleaceae bacterium]
MTKIAGMPAGSFIKRVRKQRKLPQQDLAVGIMDRTTLSKLESSAHMPPYDKLAQLVERLGFGADIIGTDERQRKSEIEGYLSRRDTESAHRLMGELEIDDDFMSNGNNRQFIIIAKVACAIIKKENPGRILTLIRKGLEITIPHFHEKYVGDYLLTSNDIELINQMTVVYWENGQRNDAINLMTSLVRNIDENCADPRYRGRNLPTLLYNLTSYLHEVGRYEDAIPLCDKGIAVCLETFALFTLPQLISNKACCLLDMGDKDESLRLYRQALVLFDVYKRFDYKEMTRDYVKKALNIEL